MATDIKDNFDAEKKLDSTNLVDIIDQIKESPIIDAVTNRSKFINDIIDNVDIPILKNLALDVANTLSGWFDDPQVMCCLIQGLWSIYATDRMQNNNKVSNTDFADYLDMLITFIDVILVIVTNEIKKFVVLIPDILREIMYGVMGSILIVLREMMYGLRDSAIACIIKWANNSYAGIDKKSVWSKCLPLHQLIDIIGKYLSDYGLLSNIEEKIKGYIGSMTKKFNLSKKAEFPKKTRDIEFLCWFRQLLMNMKESSLSYDLCIANQYSVPMENPQNDDNDKDNVENTQILDNSGYSIKPSDLGMKMSSDGTILVDKQAMDTLPLLSNSSIRGFMNKYYGYPLDVVDSLLVGASSKDSIIGTDINSDRISDLNADCPNTPSPSDIINWAIRLRNQTK